MIADSRHSGLTRGTRNRLASLAIAALVAAANVVAGWSAPPAVGADCSERTAEFSAAFDGLPNDLSVVPICPVDVGPGLAGPDIGSQFSRLTAGEVTDTSFSPDKLLLGVLVGTLKSDSGEGFVDALLSRLGPEAPQGTVTLAGRLVQYINLPGDPRGYAYGEGQTVVIGYVRAPLGTEGYDLGAMAARDAFTRILSAALGAPLPNLPPPADGLDQWPLARGRFTTATDPGWIYFRTPMEKEDVPVYSCGISPNGTMAGCDYVPDGAPTGTNQTIVDSSGARYVYSDTPTFTRDVDSLRAGERLENGPAACGVTYQGPVTCRIGEHRFIASGVLE